MSTVVQLAKGQRVTLSKDGDGVSNILIGLGWEPRKQPGVDFDLDASILMLNEQGGAVDVSNYVYYRNPKSTCGSVVCGKDNQTGDAEGDDEQVRCSLNGIPQHIRTLRVVVHIHDAVARGQNFGMVDNAYLRIEDADKGETTHRFDLSEDFSLETGVVMADIYRHDNSWKVRAVSAGYVDGLAGILNEVGLTAG